jgi:hypothetical protein
MINQTFVIIPIVDITEVMIDESLNTDTTYRKSLDESKGLLKFSVPHPNTMAGHVKYNHEEILEILAGPEWTEEEE